MASCTLRFPRCPSCSDRRSKPSSDHLTALPPSPGEGWSPRGGRRDRGPTEEGERAPGHAWSPESGPRGNPRPQTPLPVKDVKKKKLLLPFCLPSPSARPMAPPDCLRVGCAPSKWLPSSSAEPQGAWDTGHWGLGRAGRGRRSLQHWFVCGLRSGRGEGSQSQADGGSWLRVMVGGMGQMKPNRGLLMEGLGSACSLGLGKGRSGNLAISSPQEGGAKAWWHL